MYVWGGIARVWCVWLSSASSKQFTWENDWLKQTVLLWATPMEHKPQSPKWTVQHENCLVLIWWPDQVWMCIEWNRSPHTSLIWREEMLKANILGVTFACFMLIQSIQIDMKPCLGGCAEIDWSGHECSDCVQLEKRCMTNPLSRTYRADFTLRSMWTTLPLKNTAAERHPNEQEKELIISMISAWQQCLAYERFCVERYFFIRSIAMEYAKRNKHNVLVVLFSSRCVYGWSVSLYVFGEVAIGELCLRPVFAQAFYF